MSNILGAGFLENVYQRALLFELRLRGIRTTADILVEDVLVIEVKRAERLSNEHTAQCINYLRASGRSLCLLVNFQRPKVEWKRIVLDTARMGLVKG